MVTRTDATYLALSWCQRLVIVGTELVLLSIRVHLFQPSQHTEIPNERVSKHISYNRLYLPSVFGARWSQFHLGLGCCTICSCFRSTESIAWCVCWALVGQLWWPSRAWLWGILDRRDDRCESKWSSGSVLHPKHNTKRQRMSCGLPARNWTGVALKGVLHQGDWCSKGQRFLWLAEAKKGN